MTFGGSSSLAVWVYLELLGLTSADRSLSEDEMESARERFAIAYNATVE